MRWVGGVAILFLIFITVSNRILIFGARRKPIQNNLIVIHVTIQRYRPGGYLFPLRLRVEGAEMGTNIHGQRVGRGWLPTVY